MKDNNQASILIIDDEKDILDTLMHALSGIGYKIKGLSNSKIALKNIKNNNYDIVITDIMMPDISGLDIIKKVKESGKDTQIIVVTGFASLETAIKSIQYGVYDYIQKPFNIDEIRITVKNALDTLYLQRKNQILIQKIENMLVNIDLLYDISAILYQVSDIGIAMHIILDTIGEGLKIQKAAIMLSQGPENLFTIVQSTKLSNNITKQFKFHISDKIDNRTLSPTDISSFKISKGMLTISGKKIKIGTDINKCVLTPINFQDQLLGFIVTFYNMNGEMDEEKFKLLKMFSTQIAPIIHSSGSVSGNNIQSETSLTYTIRNKLDNRNNLPKPLSFSLIRIIIPDIPEKGINIKDVFANARKHISKNVNANCELVWQTMDTVLLVSPGVDLNTAEDYCINLKRILEKQGIFIKKKSPLSLVYSCTSYPQGGNDSSEIINSLWKRFFEELEKSKKVT